METNPTPPNSGNEPAKNNKADREQNGWLFIWDLVKVVVIALVIIIPIRFYVIQPFIVSGSSMEPTFENGQYLIVNELDYHIGNPQRGDVIVFKYPKNTSEYFIKRVIGLPGEKVLIQNGKVIIYNTANPNGFTLNESYLPAGLYTEATTDQAITLGPDEYFVLGDNRPASSDSRFWGDVPSNDIVGKVVLRAYPFSQFSRFSTPQYQSK
jgi:signal peptidase I